MKRVVILKLRGEKNLSVYPTVAELVARNGKDILGIETQALWNALSAGGGRFSNKRCEIYYKDVKDAQQTTWE